MKVWVIPGFCALVLFILRVFVFLFASMFVSVLMFAALPYPTMQNGSIPFRASVGLRFIHPSSLGLTRYSVGGI